MLVTKHSVMPNGKQTRQSRMTETDMKSNVAQLQERTDSNTMTTTWHIQLIIRVLMINLIGLARLVSL